jgi:two-component system, OmpR family, alkaline phosphatase synthesis response regulator PhoP
MDLTMNARVLLVEDENRLRTALTCRLREEGCVVDSMTDADAVFEKITTESFDILVLSLRLPGRNVLDLCRDIRARGIKIPILLMTSQSTTEEKILALKLGADAYVNKPFEVRELLARTEALLRRTPPSPTCQFGSIHVDLGAAMVTRDGLPVRLSTQEFRLLSYFVRHSGVLLRREEILREVWGYGIDAMTRTLDVHIASLRQKLEADPKRPNLIRTVRRLGYRFDPVRQAL